MEAATSYWRELPPTERDIFRFLNVSTDEVYGAASQGDCFDEQSPLAPNSPYAASKAAGELLAPCGGLLSGTCGDSGKKPARGSYVVGGNCCLTNREVVATICDHVDQLLDDGAIRHELVSQVADRPGHDRRYAVDASHLRAKMGWKPQIDFKSELRETVRWYLKNTDWVENVSRRAVSH
ncbi:dTDP-glucose 4,6-dehydratase 2 [Bythopirellula polymerisocia]|uniref:dTDP-glucose 4,6-dehydratase 2 n=1 Tax=Bythopirellula polymerisocia TaxID=2528003 RepID=A0A5C6CZ47_9BACT|nr:dTDP-glucose 4,6-dehydratase 2 [Bythopirellula polymerisocia]